MESEKLDALYPMKYINDTLESHLKEVQEMELETIALIHDYSSLQQNKQRQIEIAKNQINECFVNMINSFKMKQSQLIHELDNCVVGSDVDDTFIISSLATIINDQKRLLSQHLMQPSINTNASKILHDFNATYYVYDGYMHSIQQSMSVMKDQSVAIHVDKNRLSQICGTLKKLIEIDVEHNNAMRNQVDPPSFMYTKTESKKGGNEEDKEKNPIINIITNLNKVERYSNTKKPKPKPIKRKPPYKRKGRIIKLSTKEANKVKASMPRPIKPPIHHIDGGQAAGSIVVTDINTATINPHNKTGSVVTQHKNRRKADESIIPIRVSPTRPPIKHKGPADENISHAVSNKTGIQENGGTVNTRTLSTASVAQFPVTANQISSSALISSTTRKRKTENEENESQI